MTHLFAQAHGAGSVPSSVTYLEVRWTGLEQSAHRTGEDNASWNSMVHMPSFGYVCINYIVFQNYDYLLPGILLHYHLRFPTDLTIKLVIHTPN